MSNINIEDFTVVKEGQASILYPKGNKVFYNPVQQFNRDLSVCAIRAWSELFLENKRAKKAANKKRTIEDVEKEDKPAPEIIAPQPFINILEALSATGLRAIRYGKEIPHVKQVVANDFLPEAVKSIERNIEYNEATEKVVANEGDAMKYMYLSQDKNFNVIDLDPYGTAAPFIDGAIQALSNDGLLLVTCTDLAVLAGNGYPEKCFALYGGTNVWGDATHESALRLVLHMISASAAKYKKTIEPVLSLSIDFYVRLFIRVKTAPIKVKELASKTMVTYHCSGCGATYNQPLGKITVRENGTNKFGLAQGPPVGPHCTYCGFKNHMCGPMWGGNLHNKEFIDKILEINRGLDPEVYGTIERIRGMLTLAKQELDEPFYFQPTSISGIMKCAAPKITNIVAALGNLGYDASLTHAQPSCIKTNAPWDVVLEIYKRWIKRANESEIESLKQKLAEEDSDKEKLEKRIEALSNDVNANIKQGSSGYKILTSDIRPELDIDFTANELSARVDKLRKVKIVRYQQNPTKNWGPKAKPDN